MAQNRRTNMQLRLPAEDHAIKGLIVFRLFGCKNNHKNEQPSSNDVVVQRHPGKISNLSPNQIDHLNDCRLTKICGNLNFR